MANHSDSKSPGAEPRVSKEGGLGDDLAALRSEIRLLQDRVQRLGEQVERLEKRSGSERDPLRGDPSEARSHRRLMAALRDLAQDNRRLHEQVNLLASVVEGRGSVHALPSSSPEAMAAEPSPSLLQLLARGARGAAGALLETGRESWRRRKRRSVERLEIRLAGPARGPEMQLAVVVVQDGEEKSPNLEPIRAQTVEVAELGLWDVARGEFRIERRHGETREVGKVANARVLMDVVEATAVITVPASLLPRVHETWLECALLSLESERLEFVRIDLPADSSPEGTPPRTTPRSLFLTRRELWSPESGVDASALSRKLRFARQRVVGKTVALGGLPPSLDPMIDFGADRRPIIRPLGRYWVAGRRGVFTHSVAPFGEAVRPEEEAKGAGVLLLLTLPPVDGIDRLASDLLLGLGEKLRFVVATLTINDHLAASRLDQLRRFTPYIYPVGEFFCHEQWPSILARLVKEHQLSGLYHVGDDRTIGSLMEGLRRSVPGLRIVDRSLGSRAWSEVPGSGSAAAVDFRLIQTTGERAVDAATHSAKAGATLLPHGIDLDRFAGNNIPAERRLATRRELGIPADAVAVIQMGDLVPSRRPEDFLALAHRFRADPRFFFLLVGQGPLADTLGDLERYLAPPNYARLGSVPARAQVLAASDIFCSTAESEPLPFAILSALAMTRPVVAAAEEVRDLLARGPCGCHVESPGDLEGFEQAVRSLIDPERRRSLGDRGRELVSEQYELRKTLERYEDLLAPSSAPHQRNRVTPGGNT